MKFIITESEKSEIRKMYGLITEQAQTPICSNGGCSGKYTGPEFDNSGDVAHKYSNTITQYVAAKLKELYRSGIYVKVNFGGIKMTTKGMGSGNVTYTVVIPFISVSDKCVAATGFAHVGGWNHTPELNNRRNEILNYIPPGKSENVVLNNELEVSQLTKTPEGLEEYWIQWKHRDYQGDCGSQTQQGNQSQKKSYVITAPTLNDLWKKSKTSEYQNISIDENSFVVDLNSKKITFNSGNTPIKSMSFIFDDQGKLKTRLDTLKTQNSTMKVQEEDLNGPIQWAILTF